MIPTTPLCRELFTCRVAWYVEHKPRLVYEYARNKLRRFINHIERTTSRSPNLQGVIGTVGKVSTPNGSVAQAYNRAMQPIRRQMAKTVNHGAAYGMSSRGTAAIRKTIPIEVATETADDVLRKARYSLYFDDPRYGHGGKQRKATTEEYENWTSKTIERLEELDDVQSVYANADWPD